MKSIFNRKQLISQLLKNCPDCKEIIDTLKEKNQILVSITQTSDTGKSGYAVILKNSNGFWLNFFEHYARALNFCKEMNFIVDNEHN